METPRHSLLASWVVGGLVLLACTVPGFAFAQTYGEDTYGSDAYGGTETSGGNGGGGGGGGSSGSQSGTQATSTAGTAELAVLLRQILDLKAEILRLQAQLGGDSVMPVGHTFVDDLTIGSTGEDVRMLQQFLNDSGIVVNPVPGGAGAPGTESTYFGDLTREALARFQYRNAIEPAVGYFGPVTRALVNSIR